MVLRYKAQHLAFFFFYCQRLRTEKDAESILSMLQMVHRLRWIANGVDTNSSYKKEFLHGKLWIKIVKFDVDKCEGLL